MSPRPRTGNNIPHQLQNFQSFHFLQKRLNASTKGTLTLISAQAHLDAATFTSPMVRPYTTSDLKLRHTSRPHTLHLATPVQPLRR